MDHFDNEKMENRTLFEAVKAPFFFQQVAVDTDRTYTAATFTFTLKLGNPLVPPDSYLEIVLPKQVVVDKDSIANGLKVEGVKNIGADAVAAAPTTLSDGSTSIKISKLFQTASSTLPASTTLEFKLSALRTPLTTRSSDSFKIYSRDAKGRIVNYVETDLMVTMLKGRFIEGLSVASSS